MPFYLSESLHLSVQLVRYSKTILGVQHLVCLKPFASFLLGCLRKPETNILQLKKTKS